MNKIGLKLWSINTDSYYTCAQKMYQKGIFDYIELYIVPGSINTLEKWKNINIPMDIHAPHFAHKMNLSKSEYRISNYEKYKEVKIFADKLNADKIVFHGGSGGYFKETAHQLVAFQDKRILIENKPYETLSFVNEPYYVGAKYEELKYIIDTVQCGFCLDVGHCICAANSFKIEPYSYIKKLTTLNPVRIHLSDIHIDAALDEHLNFGLGNLDFKKVITMLPENINITIETCKKSRENLDDFISDVRFLREILSNMA